MDETFQYRVLALVLKNPSAWETAAPFLDAACFSDGFFKTAYLLIEKVWKKRRVIPNRAEMFDLLHRANAHEVQAIRADQFMRLRTVYETDATSATHLMLADFLSHRFLLESVGGLAKEDPHVVAERLRRDLDRMVPLLNPSQVYTDWESPCTSAYLTDREIRIVATPPPLVQTGWKKIDDSAGGGLAAGEMGIVMALTGRGKTASMLSMVVNMLEAGKKVLFFSLDNVKARMETRIYARLTGVPMSQPVSLPSYHAAVEDWFSSRSLSPDNWHVRYIEPRQVSVSMLRAMVEQAQERFGKQDVVFIDYGDQVRPDTPKNERRHELGDLFEDFRSLGKAQDVAVWTATQANRKNAVTERKFMNFMHTEENLGEAYAKAFPAALCVTINQSEFERENDPPLCRLGILKATNGERDLVLPFVSDYKIQHFYPDDLQLYKSITPADPSASAVKAQSSGSIAYLNDRYSPKKQKERYEKRMGKWREVVDDEPLEG